MKKYLFLTTLLLAIQAVPTHASIGDANNDGILTAADAATTLQYVLDSSFANNNEKCNIDNMRVLNSDNITAANAATILQKVLDSNYRFPATYITLDAPALSSLDKCIDDLETYAIPNSDGIITTVLNKIHSEMINYQKDNTYDIEKGIAEVKAMKADMTESEKNTLKNLIYSSCSVSDIENLYDFFALLIN
jgi:methionine synthase II (cobalamin-independent)